MSDDTHKKPVFKQKFYLFLLRSDNTTAVSVKPKNRMIPKNIISSPFSHHTGLKSIGDEYMMKRK
jgi:hypothetical protein